MNRRQSLNQLCRILLGAGLLPVSHFAMAVERLVKSKQEWRALLPLPAYGVLFADGTERPGSSPLDKEKRAGTYVCAACFLPLFKSEHKYDSRTGWPSFFDVLPNAVETRKERGMMLPRTEYHCARCGGHHGHLFNDGPRPTGLRYCSNGVALQFVEAGKALPALRT